MLCNWFKLLCAYLSLAKKVYYMIDPNIKRI